MSLRELMAKDRRLVILRLLAEAPQYRLNDSILRGGLSAMGHDVGRDIVLADLELLKEHQLLNTENVNAPSTGGSIIIASITDLGLDVSKGRNHPVVRRPRPTTEY